MVREYHDPKRPSGPVLITSNTDRLRAAVVNGGIGAPADEAAVPGGFVSGEVSSRRFVILLVVLLSVECFRRCCRFRCALYFKLEALLLPERRPLMVTRSSNNRRMAILLSFESCSGTRSGRPIGMGVLIMQIAVAVAYRPPFYGLCVSTKTIMKKNEKEKEEKRLI